MNTQWPTQGTCGLFIGADPFAQLVLAVLSRLGAHWCATLCFGTADLKRPKLSLEELARGRLGRGDRNGSSVGVLLLAARVTVVLFIGAGRNGPGGAAVAPRPLIAPDVIEAMTAGDATIFR